MQILIRAVIGMRCYSHHRKVKIITHYCKCIEIISVRGAGSVNNGLQC